MNAWRAPQRVVAADCPDQIADVGRDRRPADTTARLATPVQTEAAAMPAHQRRRLEDNRGFKQGGEQPIEPDEDHAICRAQPEPRHADYPSHCAGERCRDWLQARWYDFRQCCSQHSAWALVQITNTSRQSLLRSTDSGSKHCVLDCRCSLILNAETWQFELSLPNAVQQLDA